MHARVRNTLVSVPWTDREVSAMDNEIKPDDTFSKPLSEPEPGFDSAEPVNHDYDSDEPAEPGYRPDGPSEPDPYIDEAIVDPEGMDALHKGASSGLDPEAGAEPTEPPLMAAEPEPEPPLMAAQPEPEPPPMAVEPEPEPHVPTQHQVQPSAPAPQRDARNHFLTLVVVACVLLSALTGFAGGYLASRSLPSASAAAVTTTSIAGTKGATGTAGTTGTVTTAGSGSLSGFMNVADIALLAGPSVVVILTETLAGGQNIQQYVTSGAGSGVISSADGVIVTNQHVIDGAQRIIVQTADGKTFTATVIGSDTKMDLAVLHIEATGLTPARFGDSAKLAVGDPVIAIGNPLGELGGTVTNGIISALDRPITLDNETKNLLQTNAAVNPGNSGGGLFDRNGNLVGIVEAKTSAVGIEGIAFAIPINNAKPIIEELNQYGYVRGRINIGLQMVDVDTQQKLRIYRVPQLGVYVASANSNSSAAAAGLQNGDCILSVGDVKVGTGAEVISAFEKYTVGDQVSIVILRNGQQLTVTMTLQEDKPMSTTQST